MDGQVIIKGDYMKGYLNDHQIEYVLFHLGHSCTLGREVKEKMGFVRGQQMGDHPVTFRLSADGLDESGIIRLDGLPVLFPGPPDSRNDWYELKENSLVFHHDLLKSCFYLLSGIQELEEGHTDHLGRYSYGHSVQRRLGVVHLPLVNYYFEIIIKALLRWKEKSGVPFSRRKRFRDWAFFLTHDVDRIDTYTVYETGYRIKQLLGMAPSEDNFVRRGRIALRYLVQNLNPVNRKNPQWDFEFLLGSERRHHLRSAFYFLPKDRLHHDAYYRFDEERVRGLFRELDREGCEIGLHGTVASATSGEAMRRDRELLSNQSPQPVRGIRQHRLLFRRGITHLLHEEAGLQYDTTLGFAQHEGFRNSYCLPFRPYDHREERMMEIWEIPLVMMDTTVFDYRKLNYAEILRITGRLMDEVSRFHGVFTLLWHNGQADEFLRPGIREFYLALLELIAGKKPENLLGHEIVHRMNQIQ